MSGLQTDAIAVVTTGSAGSATGATTVTIRGWIESIYLDWHASAPATSDMTIAFAGYPNAGNILATTDSSTDTLYHPRASLVTAANAAITNGHSRFAANGKVTCTVAQSDALSPACTVYITYEAP